MVLESREMRMSSGPRTDDVWRNAEIYVLWWLIMCMVVARWVNQES